MLKLHTILVFLFVLLLSQDHLGVVSTTDDPSAETTLDPEVEAENEDVSLAVILAAFFYALLIVSVTIILVACVFCKCCPKGKQQDTEALEVQEKSDHKLDGINNPGANVQNDNTPL
ncbi:uncharacterized protein LOC100374056 [Saccoglossus kowalevskii]|uniref:Uncharacterized protein LOC100374056 n=1 Tax=Saccoglossus kowalevskii TaxID=10224 RepID=A0ABM0GIU1_SACKO|nr:PREDICTED: uncharacterized protein LOC100374056 [Saccoglossus kowalevskii]